MKKELMPRKRKMYSLLRKEREEVHEFILKQLRKGYIKPSNPSQMVLVFFVKKKNRKKHIVQNYRYFNEWTVKNNYLLPLISDIIENIGIKKIIYKDRLEMGLQ